MEKSLTDGEKDGGREPEKQKDLGNPQSAYLNHSLMGGKDWV